MDNGASYCKVFSDTLTKNTSVSKFLTSVLESTHWKPGLGTFWVDDWKDKEGRERMDSEGGSAGVLMEVLKHCILQELFKNS